MREIIHVANVKCGGCARTIRESLLAVGGVTDVDVVIEAGCVTVHGDDLARDKLTATLAQLGYPEISAP